MTTASTLQILSDIHFGKKSNSQAFNQAALEVVDKFIERCREKGITTGVFAGDWHDNRIVLNVMTLNYSTEALRRLNDYFGSVGGKFYFILGNHDLYYRHQRRVSSLPFLNEFKNIFVIDNPTTVEIDGVPVMMIPWLTPGEDLHELVQETKAKIAIGHLQFANCKWNSNSPVLTEGLPVSEAKKFKLLISGHFHVHQQVGNVLYVGSPLQMNFGDAGDPRGFLEVNIRSGKWKHILNDYSPRYYKIKMSEVLKNLDLIKNNHITVIEDVELKFESYSKLQKVLLDRKPLTLLFDRWKETNSLEEGEIDKNIEKLQSVEELIFTLVQSTVEESKAEQLVSIIRNHL